MNTDINNKVKSKEQIIEDLEEYVKSEIHNSEKQLFFIDALDNNDLNKDSLPIVENETIEELNRGYYYLLYIIYKINKILDSDDNSRNIKLFLNHKNRLHSIIYYIKTFNNSLRISYYLK